MDNASALRRQLLAELRHLRPPHIMTQKQIADALDWSPSKVTRIENGSVSISVTDLRALLAYYGVTGPEVVDGLVDLARRSAAPGPRSPRTATCSPRMRCGSSTMSTPPRGSDRSSCSSSPGCCRRRTTRAPSWACTASVPSGRSGSSAPAGCARRCCVVRSRRRCRFIVDESVLLRAIGGRAVMRAQLEHLLAVAARPNVTIRIIPLALGRARRPARPVRPAALLRHERLGRRLHRAAPRRRHLPGRAGGDREPRAPVRRAREARCVTARPPCVREAGD